LQCREAGLHGNSGFIGLVSCIPLLHCVPTPATVRESFAQVTKKSVADRVTTHGGRTLTSKRRAACAEYRKAVKGTAQSVRSRVRTLRQQFIPA